MIAALGDGRGAELGLNFAIFPVNFPVSREFGVETGSMWTASSASFKVIDITVVCIALVGLFQG